MALMRAKMRVDSIVVEGEGDYKAEVLNFAAVAKNEGYPEDGSDENNTFAQFTPCADLSMLIQNPSLFGKFKVGDEFYLDFTKA